MESRLEKIFSMGINSMSLAVWLGEDRKCSAAVVGLDLLLGLSTVRRCSLNRSFKRRLVSPMYSTHIKTFLRCTGFCLYFLEFQGSFQKNASVPVVNIYGSCHDYTENSRPL